MHHVLKTAPKDKMIEAASKQDYSGTVILKEWIESYKSVAKKSSH